MGESTEASGKTPTCMELAPTNGQTDESSQESMTMIRNMASAYTHGQMIESTKDGGRKENRMGWESTLCMRRLMKK
jgi:hypothetical protein